MVRNWKSLLGVPLLSPTFHFIFWSRPNSRHELTGKASLVKYKEENHYQELDTAINRLQAMASEDTMDIDNEEEGTIRDPEVEITAVVRQTDPELAPGHFGAAFLGEGIIAGEVTEDMTPHGLGGDCTGRTDEVIWCEELLSDACNGDYSQLPLFLNHSFDELCWQAREDGAAMVLVVIGSATNIEQRHHILRILRGILCKIQLTTCKWYFWLSWGSSRNGQQVIERYGGNSQEGQVLLLAPSFGGQPVFIDRISGQQDESAVGRVVGRTNSMMAKKV